MMDSLKQNPREKNPFSSFANLVNACFHTQRYVATSFPELIEHIGVVAKHLEMMRRNHKNLPIEEKEDGSFVTVADRYSSEEIMRFLSERYPHEGCISEEDLSFLKKYKKFPSEPVWILDPLDHTRRFVKGDPYYLISLTRLENFEATHTILAQPAFEATFTAIKGGGSFANNAKLKVSKISNIKKAEVATVFCELPSSPFKSLEEDKVKELGLDETPESLIAVANGNIDGSIIKMCGHKVWDIAFATLLVEEAGGKVTDERGRPISYNNIEPGIGYIVASNGKGALHKNLLNILNQNCAP